MADVSRLELLGVPCSGKSYTVGSVRSSRVRVRLAEKAKRPDRLWKAMTTSVRRPALLGLFATLGAVRPCHLAGQLRAVFRFVSRYDEYLADSGIRDGIRLVDEGMVQATWGLLLQPCLDRGSPVDRAELLRVAVKFWPSRESGCAVLFLDTPREEILQRSASREVNHPFTRIQLSGNSEAEAVGIELLQRIRGLCADLGLLLEPGEAREILGEGTDAGPLERP